MNQIKMIKIRFVEPKISTDSGFDRFLQNQI